MLPPPIIYVEKPGFLEKSEPFGQIPAKTAGFQRGDGHRITPFANTGPTLAGSLDVLSFSIEALLMVF